jgi:hypothetical protein
MAAAVEGAGEEEFVVARAVEVAGVVKVCAGVEGLVDGGDGFGLIGGTGRACRTCPCSPGRWERRRGCERQVGGGWRA